MELGCLICQECFTVNADCQATKCGHVFHKNCLTPWIKRSATCPTCRAHSPLHSLYRIFFTANPSEQSLRTDELLRDLSAAGDREQTLKNELAQARSKIAGLEDRVKALSSTKANAGAPNQSFSGQAIASSMLVNKTPPTPPAPRIVNISYIRVLACKGFKGCKDYEYCDCQIPEELILEYSVDGRRLSALYMHKRAARSTEPAAFELLPYHLNKDSGLYQSFQREIQVKRSLKRHAKYPNLYLPSCFALASKSYSYGGEICRGFYELVRPTVIERAEG